MPIHEHVRTILVKKPCLSHSLPPAHPADDKHQSYTCPHCSKLFSSPSHLSRHTLIHTGQKPCLCPECGQQFSQASSLERHQRTKHVLGKTVHSSTHRSYQCTLCHEYFSLKHNLKMHERKLHQIPTNFFCNMCSAYFTCKSSLQKHHNFRHRSAIRHPPTTASHTPSVTSAHHMSDNWTSIPNEQLNPSTVLSPYPSADDRPSTDPHTSHIDETKSMSLDDTSQPAYQQQHVRYQILTCNEMN